MFTIPEKLSTASKASFEAHLALLSSLGNKTFEGVEKIIDLNLNAAKSSLEESSAVVKQLMAAKDPQELLALASAQTQPSLEKALAYSRHLTSIASNVQTEYTRAAEMQITETSTKVLALMDELSKNAPAGSENAVAALKAAIGNWNAGYEQLNKTTKQAAEVLETSINTTVSQFAEPAAKAVAKAAKK